MNNFREIIFRRGIAKPLGKVYQKPSCKLIAYPRIASQYVCASSRGATLDRIKRGIAKPLGKVYQTKGYGRKTIPLDRIKRGIAL